METPIFGHNLLQNKELFAFSRRIDPFGSRGPKLAFFCGFLLGLGSFIYSLSFLNISRLQKLPLTLGRLHSVVRASECGC